jgi:hypothetical protein
LSRLETKTVETVLTDLSRLETKTVETVLADLSRLETKTMAHAQLIPTACHSEGLADILERVLDKGLVIAGDIKIKLCDIELLTIQIRLLVASVDKAREMGLTWWWQPEQAAVPQAMGCPAALPVPPPHGPCQHYLQFRQFAAQNCPQPPAPGVQESPLPPENERTHR